MQNPVKEIAKVVKLFTMALSPDVQKAALEKYLTPDVEFRHPICAVAKGPMSRETVVGIYQWYRIISPKIELEIKHVVPDGDRVLLLDIVQKFHLRHLPYKPVPSRLLTRVELTEVKGLYYIRKQEDFYHPDDFAALINPPLVRVIRGGLLLAGFMSCILAKLVQVLGCWRPRSKRHSRDSKGIGATSACDEPERGDIDN